MGYTKIVQYGNVTEIYSYEKDILHHPKRHISQHAKKRQKQRRDDAKAKGIVLRSQRSINRSRNNFFRLCHHNVTIAKTVHFLTLTFAYDLSNQEATRHVQRFMDRAKKLTPETPISYISVPEYTKKGRIHYHLLVFNLPPNASKTERVKRNYQRIFQRGYIDLRLARYNSKGIAGYMAKYMAKTFQDSRTQTRRGYSCSRNIEKITTYGSNSLSQYVSMIIPNISLEQIESSSYNVPYMGTCEYKKITT